MSIHHVRMKLSSSPGDTEDICRRKTTTLSKTQAPAPAPAPAKAFLHFLLEACNNYTIFLLILAAALSFAFGIKEQGIKNGWFDGVLIILTIIVLVIFRTMHNYLLERSLKKSKKHKLSNERELLEIEVLRSGSQQLISANDLVPGDIVHLWRGSLVPADGLFVAGEAFELDDGSRSIINEQNPFLFYGTRVINGKASMLVTSVGMEGTAWSETMSKATNSLNKKRTIDARLDRVTTCTHMIGLVISILILVVLFLRYTCGKMDGENGNRDTSKGEPTAIKMFINAINGIITEPKGTTRVLTTLLSLSLVGIMDGIPFVLTLAIIHWNQKNLSDKATARDLLACVTMGSVTTICTDKIGGLTENQIEVEKFLIGEEVISESSVISQDVLEGLSDGIGISVLIPHNLDSSSTGDPLFSWGQEKLGMQRETLEQHCIIIVEHKGLNPYEEQCRVLMEKNGKERSLHLRGPAAIVLANCSLYYDRRGQKHDIDNHKRRVLDQVIKDMLAKHLKVIAFACKLATDATTLEANDLTLLGLLGLKNTSLEDTRKAAATSTAAGLKTILVSRDDVTLLQRIAGECHLLTPDSDAEVLSGEDFRNFTDEERMEKVDRIRVMGNCLPSDKLLLVQCLRNKGELVAMVGQRTNDAPAMKEADIGVAMGTWSSEKAREISDIIVWDGNYSFLIDMIKFGRSFHENIRKFIQLQLIMIIAEISINFLGTAILGDAPITAIQLFWVNLVVGILGGLAILTEQPTEKLMKEKGRELPKKPLINKPMWRNIVSQASYQVAVSVTLQNKGKFVLGTSENVTKSMIFYSFILCQALNHFNARELEEKNFFKGIFQNLWFWVCFGLFTVLQVAYVLIEPIVVSTAKLNWKLWAGCFVIALGTWGIDWTVKYASGFIKKDWFTGWKIDSDFIRKGWFTRLPCLRIESVSTTPSVPPESASNLHHLSEEEEEEEEEEEITALPV